MLEIPSGRVCLLQDAGALLALVLPERALRLDHVPVGTSGPAGASGEGRWSGTGRWIDLATGTIDALPLERSADGWTLPGGRSCKAPALIVIG